MNSKKLNGKRLYVGRAQTKAERQAELKQTGHPTQGVLSFRDYHQCQGDEDGGRPKRGLWLCWTLLIPEEATKAVAEMNGRIVATKPLYVAPAQSKAQRIKFLTNKYKRMARNMAETNPNPVFISYQPAAPTGYFVAAIQTGDVDRRMPPERGGEPTSVEVVTVMERVQS
uniref:RRM domain-containing protein n=1 Tax=Hucho hucho TaxID=62062 RepID=A0A4W5PUJ7_9TELE